MSATINSQIRTIQMGRHLFYLARQTFLPQNYGIACKSGAPFKLKFDTVWVSVVHKFFWLVLNFNDRRSIYTYLSYLILSLTPYPFRQLRAQGKSGNIKIPGPPTLTSLFVFIPNTVHCGSDLHLSVHPCIAPTHLAGYHNSTETVGKHIMLLLVSSVIDIDMHLTCDLNFPWHHIKVIRRPPVLHIKNLDKPSEYIFIDKKL